MKMKGKGMDYSKIMDVGFGQSKDIARERELALRAGELDRSRQYLDKDRKRDLRIKKQYMELIAQRKYYKNRGYRGHSAEEIADKLKERDKKLEKIDKKIARLEPEYQSILAREAQAQKQLSEYRRVTKHGTKLKQDDKDFSESERETSERL